MILFNSLAGIKMLHVPYKGSTQGLIAVASGEAQLMVTGWINALPLSKPGKVRVLAAVSAKRTPAAPELPAMGEIVRGFDAEQWYGVFAPAGTPRTIVSMLNAAMAKHVQSAETRGWLKTNGAEPVGSTPEEFGARIRSEYAKWTKIVRETGLKPE